jgi:hypothetical protein
MLVRPDAPIRRAPRPGLIPLVLIALAWAAAAGAKDERGLETVGPPAPLSAEQRAQLAAKQLARIRTVPPPAPVVKAPEIVTIGEPTGVAVKAAPKPASLPAGPVPLDASEVRALELLRITLPIDVLRAAGLAKPESHGSSGVQR